MSTDNTINAPTRSTRNDPWQQIVGSIQFAPEPDSYKIKYEALLEKYNAMELGLARCENKDNAMTQYKSSQSNPAGSFVFLGNHHDHTE